MNRPQLATHRWNDSLCWITVLPQSANRQALAELLWDALELVVVLAVRVDAEMQQDRGGEVCRADRVVGDVAARVAGAP